MPVDPAYYLRAKAETLIGLYKTELVRHEWLWHDIDALELATLSWVDWFNTVRLHGSIDYVPPAEYEQREGTSQNVPMNPPSIAEARQGGHDVSCS